jgi:hypothetical protein
MVFPLVPVAADVAVDVPVAVFVRVDVAVDVPVEPSEPPPHRTRAVKHAAMNMAVIEILMCRLPFGHQARESRPESNGEHPVARL